MTRWPADIPRPDEHWQALLTKASGKVLEIGGGTGANLPFYGSGVASLTITEPSEPMARRLERRLEQHEVAAEVVRAPATTLQPAST